ncbi:hypothetical protein EOA29_01130 [Mesorhizobium sp. M1E.F.Ca.ET.063.01.1.1]|nr:hypothetical protein EOA29_01130 [Mesorhizobium sp. M1E.F.Ca.ET.063.01.1.1]
MRGCDESRETGRGCGCGRERRVPSSPPLLCRASPPQGGDRISPRLSLVPNGAGMSGAPRLPISPPCGEMAGRPEGGAVPPASQSSPPGWQCSPFIVSRETSSP